jgi:hypothetical protein
MHRFSFLIPSTTLAISLVVFNLSSLLSTAYARSTHKSIEVNNSQQLYSVLKQANKYGNTPIIFG